MTTRSNSKTVTIKTSHGLIKVNRNDLIHFPEGLLGFQEYTEFAILDIRDCKPFKSMLSVKPGGPDFVVVEPLLIFKNYTPLESFNSLGELGIGNPVDLVILSIVTLAENPEDITLNLRGPIFLNLAAQLARQVVLPDEQYLTKEPILDKFTHTIRSTITIQPDAMTMVSGF